MRPTEIWTRGATTGALALALSLGTPGNAAAQAQTAARDSLAASEDEYQGWKWFHVYCYRCHGTDAFGGQLAPDLRQSVSSQGGITKELFLTTTWDGRLPKGMPAWNQLLTQKQIEQLYAYVKARSDGRLGAGRPHREAEQP